MASTEDWGVAAGLRSRRFSVLDVPDTKLGDRGYFDAMFYELENAAMRRCSTTCWRGT